MGGQCGRPGKRKANAFLSILPEGGGPEGRVGVCDAAEQKLKSVMKCMF